MASLRLCKGGLRLIVSNAIAFDTNIWKDKLTYMKAKESDSADRSAAIERLVSIQKLGQSMDKLLSETQTALIAMVKAHETLEATIKDAEKSKTPPINSTVSAFLFKDKLRALLETAATVKTALASLSDSTESTQTLQSATTIGNKDDK